MKKQGVETEIFCVQFDWLMYGQEGGYISMGYHVSEPFWNQLPGVFYCGQ